MDLVQQMRVFEVDHTPDGWPAIRMREVSALCDEIEALKLAEEGAKEAFGHVVQQKQDAEAECKRLRELLDGAYKSLRSRDLPHAALRALVAWDGTVLPKAHDGMMQERMECLRDALGPNV
jgi:hypothetical protein